MPFNFNSFQNLKNRMVFLSINLYGNDGEIFPLCISKFEHAIEIHLLLLKDETKSHYVWVIVLQQTHHIVTHTGPHKVTSSNIHQIKAKSLPNQKLHDATSLCRGVNFYQSLKKGTHTNK